MKKMYCDKCDNEIQGFQIIIKEIHRVPPQENLYDLCSTCHLKFKEFMIKK